MGFAIEKKRDFVPHFESMEGKVLSWTGFYREAIEDSPVEAERLRRVKFIYYLVDDTCEASNQENDSGLPQGGFSRDTKLLRQMAPLSHGRAYALAKRSKCMEESS